MGILRQMMVILMFVPLMLYGQIDPPMLEKLKNPYIKTEEIDLLVSSIKKSKPGPSDTAGQRIFFETCRLAADRYAGNNHFKQAYLLYKEYLTVKEDILSGNKIREVEFTVNKQKAEQSKRLAEISSIKKDIAVMESEKTELSSRNNNFIRNMSFLVLLMTVLFIIMFSKISGRLNILRENIGKIRRQLIAMEKNALLGRLSGQINKISRQQVNIICQESGSINELFIRTEKEVTKEDLPDFKKLRGLFSKAEAELNIISQTEDKS